MIILYNPCYLYWSTCSCKINTILIIILILTMGSHRHTRRVMIVSHHDGKSQTYKESADTIMMGSYRHTRRVMIVRHHDGKSQTYKESENSEA